MVNLVESAIDCPKRREILVTADFWKLLHKLPSIQMITYSFICCREKVWTKWPPNFSTSLICCDIPLMPDLTFFPLVLALKVFSLDFSFAVESSNLLCGLSN